MCLYCKKLSELRREDLRNYEKTIEKYKGWFRDDTMLLRRCLIALDWKDNQELIDDIFKVIELEDYHG